MARFRFALEPVLAHRKRIEEREQGLVAIATRAHAAAITEFARLNDAFAEHSLLLRERHRNLTSEDLQLMYGHLSYLDRAMDAAKRDVDERKRELDEAMTALHEAMKRRKVVETLKERGRERFRLEALRHEQNELDDGNARRQERRTANPIETGGQR